MNKPQIKSISEWSKAQKVVAFFVSLLTGLITLATIAAWAGDTRWVQIADALEQSKQISDFVNIEQYIFRRDNLIMDKVGKPHELQELYDAKIEILNNRIDRLENNHR